MVHKKHKTVFSVLNAAINDILLKIQNEQLTANQY